MFGGIRRWKCVGAAALIVTFQLALVTGWAWGQVEVNLRDNDTGAWPWLVALGLILLLSGAAFMNSKRSHLD